MTQLSHQGKMYGHGLPPLRWGTSVGSIKTEKLISVIMLESHIQSRHILWDLMCIVYSEESVQKMT